MLENFLTGDELDAVLAGVKQLPAGRGRHARSEVVRSLMAHEKILPLVVDCAGWNIQCRECILSKAGPMAGAASPDKLAAPWHFDYEEEHYGTTHDGLLPMLDFKASWYLSDHTEEGHAAT